MPARVTPSRPTLTVRPIGSPTLVRPGARGEQGIPGAASGPLSDASVAAVIPATATKAALDATYGLKPTNAARTIGKGELLVNAKDHGALGDCAYLDQRVTGTWGLSTATPVAAGTYGRGYTNSGYTTAATDNTTAFRAAWDAMVNDGTLSLREKASGTYTGRRGSRRELYIPAGAYYISDAAALFSYLRSTPSGTQAGFTVRGDGMDNTILYVRIPGVGSTDYMVYDVDQINKLAIKDLTIICTTGTERLFYSESTVGQTGRWHFDRVAFNDYLTCFTLAGTTNADRWSFDTCDWTSNVQQAKMLSISGNSQAVDYVFTAPSITHNQGGSLFDIAAGGNIKVFGGCLRVGGADADSASGVISYVDGTAGLVSEQTYPVLTCYGVRFEIQGAGGLCDLNASEIVFHDCIAVLISTLRAKPHVIIRTTGRVVWQGGVWPAMNIGFSTAIATDYPKSNRASMFIRNAKTHSISLLAAVSHYTTAGDGTTTAYSSAGTGGGGARGRIFVEGCEAYGVNYASASRPLVNGAPYSWYGWEGYPAKVQREVQRQGTALAAGLGDEAQTTSVVLPANTELLRVGIVKGSGNTGIGANTRTWKVKDGNAATLATLTALGTDTYVQAISEIYRPVSTVNDRTLTLSCDAATPTSVGTYADGYWFVEYV